MASYPATSLWPSTPLPEPVRPIPPDFYSCHPFYGNNLITRLCVQAASRLPSGSTPVVYGYPPGNLQDGSYNLPREIKQDAGNGKDYCLVTIDAAFTTSSNPTQRLIATPDLFRAATSWLIDQCVTPNFLGGFATVSLQSMIDWVANDSTTNQQLRDWAVPFTHLFYTITISGTVRAFPAEYDPSTAEAIADGVRAKGNVARGNAIENFSNILWRSANTMFAWWEVFKYRAGGQPQGQSLPLSSDMVYTCDADLGAPSTVDCSQLAYSGIPGAPSDTVVIGPGSETKFISRNSCNVGITAQKTIVLRWAQVQAGVNALVDNCVLHPLVGARGGRAYASSSIAITSGKKGRRSAAPTPVNGLDALPPGVNLTLFEQDFEAAKDPSREVTTCTWIEAVGPGKVDICPPGT